MAEPFIHFQLEGVEKVKSALRRVESMEGSLGDLLGAVGQAAEGIVLGRFEGERGPGGVPWPKSKRALGTAPNIRGNKVPGKTLVDSAELRNSLKVEVRDKEVEVGFRGLANPMKATANQFGSNKQTVVVRHTRTIKSAFGIPLPEPREVNVRAHGRITNLPARPMLGIDAEMTDAVAEVGRLFVLDILQRR